MSESKKKGKPFVLVDPSSADDYTCHICMELLENPKDTRCGHTFCLVCITAALSVTPACPLCRTPTSTDALREPNYIFKGQMEKLQVYCINRPDCNWVGKKGDGETHLASECEFQLLPCQNSKILDLPACPKKIYRTAVRSHLKECQFEQLKSFFTKLVEHCRVQLTQGDLNMAVKQLQGEINLAVDEVQGNFNLKVIQLKDNLNLDVDELRKVQGNCNRVINVSTMIPYSLPLPPPPITGQQYITFRDVCGDKFETSVIIPGGTYEPNNQRLKEEAAFDALNILAKMGYSISVSTTSIKHAFFVMEYTGAQWSNNDTQSGVEWPPYIWIRVRSYSTVYHITMLPTLTGYPKTCEHASGILALVNSIVAKHPYRVISNKSYDNWLLQKCPAM